MSIEVFCINLRLFSILQGYLNFCDKCMKDINNKTLILIYMLLCALQHIEKGPNYVHTNALNNPRSE